MVALNKPHKPHDIADDGTPLPDPKYYKPEPTVGERKFKSRVYFWLAGVGTLIASVGIAYVLKDSLRNIPFTSTSFKETYDNLSNKLGTNYESLYNSMVKSAPLTKLSDYPKLSKLLPQEITSKQAQQSAGDAMLTTVTFFGGLLPIPIIRNLEARKKQIVHDLNEKYGTAEDVKQGDLNVHNEPPQSMMSLIKGRALAWVTVFGSLTFASNIIPKTFGGLEKDFEILGGKMVGATYEKLGKAWPKEASKFFAAAADKVAGISSEQADVNSLREVFGDAWKQRGNATQELLANKNNPEISKQFGQVYRTKKLSNITAVDIFATTAAVLILVKGSQYFSQKIAEKREAKEVKLAPKVAVASEVTKPKKLTVANKTEKPDKVSLQENDNTKPREGKFTVAYKKQMEAGEGKAMSPAA